MEDTALRELIYRLLATGALLHDDLESAENLVSVKVATETEMSAALEDSKTQRVVLTNDIVTLKHFVVNRSTPLEIDFNGYKIASLATDCAIDLLAGELELTGKGSVVASGQAAGIRVHGAMTADNARYAQLTVDAEVTLFSPRFYGIQIVATGNAAYGISIQFAGKIIAKDGIGIHSAVDGEGKNLAHIQLCDGSKIEVDATEGAGIRALGRGIWQLDQTEINAATDIVCQAGQMHLRGSQLTATGDVFSFTEKATRPQIEIVTGEFVAQRALFAHLPAEVDLTVKGGTIQVADTRGLAEALPAEHHLDRNRRTGEITVVGPQHELIIDPVEKFKHEQMKLDILLAKAQEYLALIESGEGMGDWQDAVEKAANSVHRAINSTHKLLKSKSVVLDQILHAEQKIQTAMRNIEQVEDDLRAEIFSVLAMAQELSPRDYSEYSYNILFESMQSAEQILTESGVTIDQLYSILCDVNLNLDLLEEPEETGIEDYMGIAAEIASQTEPERAVEFAPEETIEASSEESTKLAPEAALEVSSQELRTFADLGAAVLLSALLQSTELLNENVPDAATPEEMAIPEMMVASEEVVIPEAVMASKEAEIVDTEAERTLADAMNSLHVMLEAVQDLRLNDYREEFVEQFGELQVAIARAQSVLAKSDAVLPEILDTMDAVKFATAGLRVEPRLPASPREESILETPAAINAELANQTDAATSIAAASSTEASVEALDQNASQEIPGLDWTELSEAVKFISSLNPVDYTAESYERVMLALERAKPMLANSAATQNEINDLVFDLNLTIVALERQTQAPVSDQFQSQANINQPARSGQFVGITQVAYQPASRIASPSTEPTLLSSIATGISSGLTAYRRSRLVTKRRKLLRKAEALSKSL